MLDSIYHLTLKYFKIAFWLENIVSSFTQRYKGRHYRLVHLAENDRRSFTNSLRKVINSFSIRKVSCFIEKKS